MANIYVDELYRKLEAEGTSDGLVYSLLIYLRDLAMISSVEAKRDKLTAASKFAKDLLAKGMDDDLNTKKVLKGIAKNPIKFDLNSNCVNVVVARVLVDNIAVKYDSKDDAKSAFESVLKLKKVYSEKSNWSIKHSKETKALEKTIAFLTARLVEIFGEHLAGQILDGKIKVDQITKVLPSLNLDLQ